MRQPDSRGNDKAYVQQKLEQALKLKQLMIQDVTVTDLAQFQNAAKVAEVVQVVNVSNCPKLRGKDLEAVGVPQNGKGCIRKLTFIQSGLDSIPASLFPAHASTLQLLNLSGNSLLALPPSLALATALKDLDLSSNAFTAVPPPLASLPHLQTLSLSHNSLTAFDPAFLTLPSLEYLYLSHNLIAVFAEIALPDEVYEKSAIRVLDLSFNRLTTIPAGMLKGSRVHNLNLQGNAIRRKELMRMDGLEEYQERRKVKMDIVVKNNLDVDYNICGLTE